MAVLRAYMMAANRQGASLPGRGVAKGDPFLGLIAGAASKFAMPLIRKGAGRLLSKVTGGKLIGKGGATAALKRAAGAAGGFGTAVGAGVVASRVAGRFGGAAASGRRRRRMNAGNAKALRKAIRRMEAFGKLAMKCGYVRRKPAGHFTRKRASGKVC